jgi:hypothetical protein
VATLDQLRAKLNGELGVDNDGEAKPWSTTVRNQAISDGYAELWRAGVWKHQKQDLSTVTDQWLYALTAGGIRKLERLELLDSSSRVVEQPRGVVEDDGSGAWHLRLASPLATGYTLRVRGWGPYKSVFSGGSDPDDLPAEHSRVPLLKSKAILYRAQLSRFARYGARQALPAENNMTIDQLIAMVAACEREFETEAGLLSGLRRRSSKPRTV